MFNYDVIEVSRYIIDYSNKMGYGCSYKKLQPLLYFVQSYFLSLYEEACFKDDIIAKRNGPTVSRIEEVFGGYFSLKYNIFHDTPILSYAHEQIINDVIDKFADYAGSDLITIIKHQAPWKIAYYDTKDKIITHTNIKQYFCDTPLHETKITF